MGPSAHCKRLVLVRHGEVDLTEFDGRKAFYGGKDVPLSARGRAEAQAAADLLLKEEAIDIMWSSPLSRALYGARCIAEAQGIAGDSITLHDSFREVDRGAWVGKTAEEVGAAEIEAWNRDPNYDMPGGGESLAAVAKRVLAAKDQLLEKSPWGSTTALVSHMWVTRSILAEALGYDTINDTSKLHTIDLPTASISVLEYSRTDGPKVLYTGLKPVAEESVGDSWGS